MVDKAIGFSYIIIVNRKDLNIIRQHIKDVFPNLVCRPYDSYEDYTLNLPEIDDAWDLVRIDDDTVKISSSLYKDDGTFDLYEHTWNETPIYKNHKDLGKVLTQITFLKKQYNQHLMEYKLERIKRDF